MKAFGSLADLLLYHFTARDNLEAIQAEGLTRGDVPITQTEGLQAVWLTTNKDSDGHGLSDDRPLTEEEIAALKRISPKTKIPEGARMKNKRAVRITVKIPRNDRKLEHWPKWGKKHLDHTWFDTLNRTGGGKYKTWFLYFGVIPPDWFTEVVEF